MKKLVSLLLALILVMSLAPMALTESDFAKTIDISIGTAEVLADDSYLDNYFFKFIEEKFNVKVKVLTVSADFDGLTNLWIASGEMPDLMTYGNNLASLVEYAEQGLLAPLPEGWKDKYPNLARDFDATYMEKYVTASDGQIYAIPRVIMSPNFDISLTGALLDHPCLYYRADWAEKLGFDNVANMMDLETAKAYMKAAMEANLDGVNKVYGLTGTTAYLVNALIRPSGVYYNKIYLNGDHFVLGATEKGTVEGIQLFKDLYDEGFIDPDFYTYKNNNEPRNLWYLGQAALLSDNGHAEAPLTFGNALIQNNPNVEEGDYDAFGCTNILGYDGQYRYFWADTFSRSLVFKPEVADDPEKFDRLLSILDYLATVEGVCTLRYGEQGVNWEFTDDPEHPINFLEPYEYGAGAPKVWYNMCPSSQDALGYSKYMPDEKAWSVQKSVDQRLAKAEYCAEDEPPYEDVVISLRWTSDAMNLFKAIDWRSEVIRIVLAEGADVETEWNNFVETNRPLWEPLLNELNATLQ